MKLSFAPLEGITMFVYRNAYEACVPGRVDRYYSPFLTTANAGGMGKKELRDILPEHNKGIPLIPQLLTRKSEEFVVVTREKLLPLGYEEVNLNLGCPSGTVTAKGKGSGFLKFPEELDRFFDFVFTALGDEVKISVKTRIGSDSPEEFPQILEIYNRYPIAELIIHPRLRADKYKNVPNLEMFRLAYETAAMPLCYNGDLFCVEDVQKFHSEFPEVKALMLGRGLIGNPGLAGELRGEAPITKEKLREFHDAVTAGFRTIISGDRSLMFKMREVWAYMGCMFEGNEKFLKRIRKAQHFSEYLSAVEDMFASCELSKKGFVPF